MAFYKGILGICQWHFPVAFSNGIFAMKFYYGIFQWHLLKEFAMAFFKGIFQWHFGMPFPKVIFQWPFAMAFFNGVFQWHSSNGILQWHFAPIFSNGIFQWHFPNQFSMAFWNGFFRPHFPKAFPDGLYKEEGDLRALFFLFGSEFGIAPFLNSTTGRNWNWKNQRCWREISHKRHMLH